MKRSDFIQRLADFLDTFPEGASSYHICDMLIGRAEKMGMKPTKMINLRLEDEYFDYLDFCVKSSHIDCIDYGKNYYVNEWEKEEEEDYL